jgi:hypothetical protein
VYATLGERFRRAVPQATFLAIVADLQRQFGRLLEVRVLDETRALEATTVYLAAFFERGTRRYEVAVDAQGVVQGLLVSGFAAEAPSGQGPADDYVAERAYSLPLRGTWTVSNGGREGATNHHVGNAQQWYAFDFHRSDAEGRPARNDGSKNEEHLAWDQAVVAPADAIVASVVNGIPEHEPAHSDRYFVPGNLVVLDHGAGEFSFLAHLRPGSIAVKTGQRVKRGELLGKVGNSGNSSAPHLHWHLASAADVSRGHGLPIRFAPLIVNGQRVEAATPIRGDLVANDAAAK